MTPRQSLYAIIEANAKPGVSGIHDAWRKLYARYKETAGVDVEHESAVACATKLDWAEDHGHLDGLMGCARDLW